MAATPQWSQARIFSSCPFKSCNTFFLKKKSYYFLDEVTAIAALVKTQNTNATKEEEYRANPAVIPEIVPFFIDFSL